MPKFNIEVPHPLSQQEAKARLERFSETLQQKFQNQVSDLQQSWNNDTLHFQFKTFGIQLAGDITVAASALRVAVELPFTAMMFKGKIESAIRDELQRLVGSEKSS